MPEVLVTGADGFVGSHLVDYLASHGYTVRAMDLRETPKNISPSYLKYGVVEYTQADLTNPESLKPLVDGVDVVFHPAALFNLCISPDKLWEVNVNGTLKLCKEASRAGVKRLINWSSSTVYGAWLDSDEEGNPRKAVEDDFFSRGDRTINEYAHSKRKQEIRAHATYNLENDLRITTVRPANIYGRGTSMGLAFPLKNIKKGLLKRPPAIRDENGEYIQAYSSQVHVDDVVRAAVFLANTPEAVGKHYNLAEDTPISMDELFDLGCRLLGKERKEGYDNPIAMKIPAYLFSGIAKARNLLAHIFTFGRLKTRWYPLFDAESVELMVKHHVLDNSKIRSLGFKFEHDIRNSLEAIVKHHEETGWKEIPMFKREPAKIG